MKKILSILFAIISFYGCSKSSDEQPPQQAIPDYQEQLGRFRGYNVSDTVGITSIVFQKSKRDTNFVFISGFKKDKIWYGMYDCKTKNPIFEVQDKEVFNYTQTANLGYGEYKNFIVGKVGVYDDAQSGDARAVYLSFVEKTNSEFDPTALYVSRLDFIEKNSIIKSIYNNYWRVFYAPELYEWKDAFISTYMESLSSYSVNGDVNFETDKISEVFYKRNAYCAINEEECISIEVGANGFCIRRENIKNHLELWHLEENKKYHNYSAKIGDFNFIFSNDICTISFSIISLDGTKEDISAKVNIEKGSIIQGA